MNIDVAPLETVPLNHPLTMASPKTHPRCHKKMVCCTREKGQTFKWHLSQYIGLQCHGETHEGTRKQRPARNLTEFLMVPANPPRRTTPITNLKP